MQKASYILLITVLVLATSCSDINYKIGGLRGNSNSIKESKKNNVFVKEPRAFNNSIILSNRSSKRIEINGKDSIIWFNKCQKIQVKAIFFERAFRYPEKSGGENMDIQPDEKLKYNIVIILKDRIEGIGWEARSTLEKKQSWDRQLLDFHNGICGKIDSLDLYADTLKYLIYNTYSKEVTDVLKIVP
jgi:hypothetical protein